MDACLAVLALPPSGIRSILLTALMFIGVAGGVTEALFRRCGGLDRVSTLALAACLSVALGGLGSLLLSHLPGGLQESNVAGLLAILASTGVLAWSLSVERPGRAIRDVAERTAMALVRGGRSRSAGRWLVTGILAVLFGTTAAMAAHNLELPPSTLPMTEFYVLGSDAQLQDPSTVVDSRGPLLITCGVANHEGRAVEYRVIALVGDLTLLTTGPLLLGNGESRMTDLALQLPPGTVSSVRVDLVLMMDGEPWRKLHLWRRVINEGQGG
jgi:uncharacterized membrane protein